MKNIKEISTSRIVKIALFTALIIVGTYIKIETPAMSFTLQFLFVILAGLVLGKNDGVVCVAVYILIGLLGVPVFARGGGFSYVVQPSFGYIVAFLPTVYIAGCFSEKERGAQIGGLLVALLVEYLIGAAYYWLVSKLYLGDDIGMRQIMTYCVLLILPADLISCFIAVAVARRLKNK